MHKDHDVEIWGPMCELSIGKKLGSIATSAPMMANKPRAYITVTVAKGQSVAVAGHALTEQSFEEHGQAESECGHDRDSDHRADT